MRTAIYLVSCISVMLAGSAFAMEQGGANNWLQLLVSSWLTAHVQRLPEQELPALNLKEFKLNSVPKYTVRKNQQPHARKKRVFSQHHK